MELELEFRNKTLAVQVRKWIGALSYIVVISDKPLSPMNSPVYCDENKVSVNSSGLLWSESGNE